MAQNNLGIALMAQGQFAPAAERFRKAIALDPDFAQPKANLGYVLGRLGEGAAAVDALGAISAAIQRMPRFSFGSPTPTPRRAITRPP